MRPVAVADNQNVLSFDTEKGATYIVDRPDEPWEDQPIVKVTAPKAVPMTPEWFRISVPGVWPNGWHLIGSGSGRFVPTPDGAVMNCHGPAGSTSGWQLPTAPIDTSRYPRLEAAMYGVGNGKIRIQ